MGQFRAISSLKDMSSQEKKGRYYNITCQPMPFNNNYGKESHYASVEKDHITVKIGALPHSINMRPAGEQGVAHAYRITPEAHRMVGIRGFPR
jgi:hypothetical protein